MTTRRKQLHGQTRRAVLAREPGGLTEPPAPPADLKVTPPEPEPEPKFEPLPMVFLGRDGHDE